MLKCLYYNILINNMFMFADYKVFLYSLLSF